MKFVSETMKVPEPIIEVTAKGRKASASIKYPAPRRQDWVNEEYEDEEDLQEDDHS